MSSGKTFFSVAVSGQSTATVQLFVFCFVFGFVLHCFEPLGPQRLRILSTFANTNVKIMFSTAQIQVFVSCSYKLQQQQLYIYLRAEQLKMHESSQTGRKAQLLESSLDFKDLRTEAIYFKSVPVLNRGNNNRQTDCCKKDVNQ